MKINEIIEETLAEQILEQSALLPEEFEISLPEDAFQLLIQEEEADPLSTEISFVFKFDGYAYSVSVRSEADLGDWTSGEKPDILH